MPEATNQFVIERFVRPTTGPRHRNRYRWVRHDDAETCEIAKEMVRQLVSDGFADRADLRIKGPDGESVRWSFFRCKHFGPGHFEHHDGGEK